MATISTSITTRYFMSGNGANFTDFAFPYDDISLVDQGISFVGGNGIDQVFIGAASGMFFDFSEAGLKTDLIYFEGALSDYVFTNSGLGTSIVLTRPGDNGEVVKVSQFDSLIFSDGLLTGAAALNFAKDVDENGSGATSPSLDNSVTSTAFPMEVAGTFDNTLRAFVSSNSDGETIGVTRPGVALIVVGGRQVDIVYAVAGGNVDATQLGLGQDKIYLTGNYADYTVDRDSGSVVTLTRTVDGNVEVVKFTAGSASYYDEVIFIDGATTTYAIQQDTVTLNSAITTPLPLATTIAIDKPISAGYINASEDDSALTITGTSENAVGLTAEVTVGSVTKSALIARDGTWSVEVSAAQLQAMSEGSIAVKADLTGNDGKAISASASFIYDIQKPTVTITDDQTDTGNIAGGDITYTFTFSESVENFVVGDVTVANGTAGTLTKVSGSVYTLAVTPTAGFEGNVTVDVAADVATDAAGNNNLVATQSVQAVDMLAPSVTITDNVASTANIASGDITYTFTFSEAVTGFSADDVTVANGSKGTFTAVSSTVYTLVVTPTGGLVGNVTVDVAADVAVDASSNGNTVATQRVQAVDLVAPTAATAAPTVSTDLDSANRVNETEFLASINISVSIANTGALVGDKVELLMDGESFSTPLYSTALTGQNISSGSITVTIPAEGLEGDGSKSITSRVIDAAGNPGAQSAALGLSVDTGAAPELVSLVALSPTASLSNADQLVFRATFNEAIKVSSITKEDFTIKDSSGAAITTTIGTPEKVTSAQKAWDITVSGGDLEDYDGDVVFGFASDAEITDTSTAAKQFVVTNDTVTITLDNTKPSAATSAPTSTEGPLISSAEYSDGIPVVVSLAGTNAVAGDTLELKLGGASFATPLTHTLTPDDITAGTVSLTVAADSLGEDGTKLLTSVVTDQAGNVGTASSALTLTLDTTAPTALSAPTSSEGPLISATEYSDGVPVSVSLGSLTTGAALELFVDGTSADTHTLTSSDKGSYSFTLANDSLGSDGAKAITVKATDVAGNTSAASEALTLTLDTTAPTLSSLAINTPTTANTNANTLVYRATFSEVVTGVQSGDFVLTLTDTSGTDVTADKDVSIGTPVKVSDGVYDVTVSGSGTDLSNFNGNVTLGIKDGVSITDTAGNAFVKPTTTATYTIDNVAPSAASAAPSGSTAGTTVNAAEHAAGFSVTASLAGTNAVKGDSIELKVGGASFSTPLTHTLTQANIDAGSYTFTLASSSLGSDGLKQLTSVVTDAAGNIGLASAAYAITLDGTAPTASAAPTATAANDGVINAVENNNGFEVKVSLVDTLAKSGDVVEILRGGSSFDVPLTKTLSDSDITAKSVTLTVAANTLGDDGSKSLTSTITDAAGNTSAQSSALTFTLNSGSAPKITYSAKQFYEKSSNDGAISNSITLSLTGATFAGDDDSTIPSTAYTVSNLPTGLTVKLVKTSDTTATLSLTGNAATHANANDVSNLTLALKSAAFDGTDASGVTNATVNNLTINFADLRTESANWMVQGNPAVGTSGDDIIYGAATSSTTDAVILPGDGADTIIIGNESNLGSTLIQITSVDHGPNYVVGFKGGQVEDGSGDQLDLSGIANLSDSLSTGLSLSSDFSDNNVFIFNSTSIKIADAAAAIAADSDVTAQQGFIVIKDVDNNGMTTVYHSTDLAGDGVETALVMLSGTTIGSLISDNLIV